MLRVCTGSVCASEGIVTLGFWKAAESCKNVTELQQQCTSVVGDEDCLLAGEAAVCIAAGNFSCRVPQHASRLNAILFLQHVHQADLHGKLVASQSIECMTAYSISGTYDTNCALSLS